MIRHREDLSNFVNRFQGYISSCDCKMFNFFSFSLS
jgi:hypothetical protein